MTSVLYISNHPESVRKQYYNHIRASFPQLTVNVVDHHTKVDPYIASANVVLAFGTVMADHVVRDAPNMRWIHALGTGTDGIDDLPSLRHDVLLTSTRGIHGAPMSEAALAAMLALSRNLHRTVRNQQRHAWQRPLPTLLEGKTVGIFGLGIIGSTLVPKCKALGMKVIGVDPLKPDVPGLDRSVTWQEALPIVPELDYVVLFIPSSPQTHAIVNGRFLAAMKPTSYLVNLGRGDVLDEEALTKVLQEQRIAGAALDVFRHEPLPENHPFWGMENVIVTPHLGGMFDEYPQRALPIFCENMRRFLAGDFANMINLVKH